jgi:hypothetical protein
MLPFGLGVEGSFGEKNYVIRRVDAKLLVEGVVPACQCMVRVSSMV